MKVLYLDIEGGTGGSSRSLFFLIKQLLFLGIEPRVISLKNGPITDKYHHLGVPYSREPGLLALPTMLRNQWLGVWWMLTGFLRHPGALQRLIDTIGREGVDIVHINHTTLFPTAILLRRFCRIPVVMHVRVQNYDTRINRLYARLIAGCADRFIFITENEKDTLLQLSNREEISHEVIYNIAEEKAAEPEFPEEFEPYRHRFRIISLKNIHYFTGINRMVDIAAHLKTAGENRIIFVVLGGVKEEENVKVIRREITERGLDDYFLFLGPREAPEQYLRHSQLLINLSRKGNPWGRDIIEALAAAVPPVTLGRYDRFVRHGETGMLYAEFDSAVIARDLAGFIDDPDKLSRMKKQAVSHAERLFSGKEQAKKTLSVYQKLVRNRMKTDNDSQPFQTEMNQDG